MTAIDEKYAAMGGTSSLLGVPVTPEHTTADGSGRYRHFQHGSIYWSPTSGAHEVHGDIRGKWAALSSELSLLGYPITDEITTPDGSGRYNHFQGGSIYWSPHTGAHEVHGDIREKWAETGWEQGSLGYPTSDEQSAPGDVQLNHFEHGTIEWRLLAAPLTVVQYNMALLAAPAAYLGTERERAIRSLTEHLRTQLPDVIGLSECFVDSERAQIKDALEPLGYSACEGPDEEDLESDGGLMLLSRHSIITDHQSIYRQCLDADCFANKGVLHARIQPAGHPTTYDLFLTHLQNPNANDLGGAPNVGPGQTGRAKVQRQLDHLNSFIQANRRPDCPALLLGDLNTSAGNTALYDDLLLRLSAPVDLWTIGGDGSLGITSGDPANTFSGGVMRPPESGERGLSGARIDYFLYWRGTRYWPVYTDTRVLIWQSSSGRDLSDHYGLQTRQVTLRELVVTVDRPIAQVTVRLDGFHCLTETGGPVPVISERAGSDEVEFEVRATTANGAEVQKRAGRIEGIDSGARHNYSAPAIVTVGDPGAWLDVTTRGWEVDPIEIPIIGTIGETDRAVLGVQRVRFSRSELLALNAWAGRSTTRVLPLLTGHGSEYAVRVTVVVTVA